MSPQWILLAAMAILAALLVAHLGLRRQLLARLGAIDPARRRALGETRLFELGTLAHGWRILRFICGRRAYALDDPALVALVRGERWLYLAEVVVLLAGLAAIVAGARSV